MLYFNVAMLSKPGGRKCNEDACGHWSFNNRLCCVLADGAGGHGGGDTASRLAVTSLLTGFSKAQDMTEFELLALVRAVNDAVIEARVPGSVQQDMHSTIVCLVIDAVQESAVWAHCGDSRVYWFRQDRMIERSHDHSIVQSLVDAGLLQESKTRSHPQRSQLYSALGKQTHELEVSASEPSREVSSGDKFLLCSDGVWEYLTDDLLEQTLQDSETPKTWLNEIERRINEAARGLSSHDNFTALTVWIGTTPLSQ